MKYMTGDTLEAAQTLHPDDVIASLEDYALNGGDIDPTIYDHAIEKCVPPMSTAQLGRVVELCTYGISTNHLPKTPIDHSRAVNQKVEASPTQIHYAALAGAAFVRQVKLSNS